MLRKVHGCSTYLHFALITMDEHETYNLSGSLLEWPVQAVQRAQLEQCEALKYKGTVGASRWEEFEFASEVPLRGEDETTIRGPFRYIVICRRSGARIAILSHNRRIVDRLTDRLVSEVFALRLRRVSIAVHSLVASLVERPTRFCLSFVYARVPAFGAALRNIAFYGDDLGEASLFRENIHLINVFVSGLRRTEGGSEILRLTSDGRISFNMSSADKVIEVEEVLGFLREEQYLSTEIWPQG